MPLILLDRHFAYYYADGILLTEQDTNFTPSQASRVRL